MINQCGSEPDTRILQIYEFSVESKKHFPVLFFTNLNVCLIDYKYAYITFEFHGEIFFILL